MVDLTKNKKLISKKRVQTIKNSKEKLLFPDEVQPKWDNFDLSDEHETAMQEGRSRVKGLFDKFLKTKEYKFPDQLGKKGPVLKFPNESGHVLKKEMPSKAQEMSSPIIKITKKDESIPTPKIKFNKTNIEPIKNIEEKKPAMDFMKGVFAKKNPNQPVHEIKTEEEKLKEIAAESQEELKEHFYIDLRPRLIKLPDIKDRSKINIRYPLIPPYAFAHIYWDHQSKELIYALEEPELSKQEKELLKLIKIGLEEMITVSFTKLSKINLILEYLEKNVQAILIELGVKITKQTYQNIMYYSYRDSVGFNFIEPLLKDYYIEDIECNGVGFPLYIVHRKYENLRTTIQYDDYNELADFIEKLAQKTGRYVSYAQPLLDGALPDGSRVNATYSRDITTRGPTFTIRKFTKEPWTPVHLIDFKTGSAESFAYLWLAIENKFNVMVVGETGAGKTTFLNCIVSFIPPAARICSIEDTRELNLAHDNWLPSVQRMGFGIPNLAGERYGEVNMFDLLRESFRQNPDYVIVGEVRGKEAYVLFQGMASGHPSFGTFHSGSVENLIRRLETPPINLSSSLVETLDIVCITIHEKTPDKNIRRLKSVEEIIEVKQNPVGEAKTNTLFEWNPAKDTIKYNGKSVIFDKIVKRTGQPLKDLEKEFKRRTQLLEIMHKKGLMDFKQFNAVINRYYKNPKGVLKEFKIK